jgi:hypothetical protein
MPGSIGRKVSSCNIGPPRAGRPRPPIAALQVWGSDGLCYVDGLIGADTDSERW